ncbi:MAG: transposase [Planctomycetes bacterium]|nr:transposase [Planctomycetota bacterium]
MHRSSYKTRRRFEIANQPRFLTFSCYKRLPLFGNDAIKDAFATRLEVSRVRLSFRLCAWVVMPAHVHLIIVPNLAEVSTPQILSAIKRPFAELVLRRWKQLRNYLKTLNRLYQSKAQANWMSPR